MREIDTPFADLLATPARRRDCGAFGRHRWRLWMIVCNISILVSMIVCWQWPVLKVTRLRFEGPEIWRERALATTVVPSDANFVRTDPSETEARLAATFAGAGSGRACLELPNTLRIRLDPCQPVFRSDAQTGVAVDGSLLPEQREGPSLPLWRPEADIGPGRFADRVENAAGAWAEIVGADGRFAIAISDFRFDSETGWETNAMNGVTRIILGKTDLRRRAAMVSHLLAQPDSVLFGPCVIDARFNGQLAVRPLPKPVEDSTAAPDTILAVAANDAKNNTAEPLRLKPGSSRRRAR